MPDYDKIADELRTLAPSKGVDPNDAGKLTRVGMKYAKANGYNIDPMQLNSVLLKRAGIKDTTDVGYDESGLEEVGKAIGSGVNAMATAGTALRYQAQREAESLGLTPAGTADSFRQRMARVHEEALRQTAADPNMSLPTAVVSGVFRAPELMAQNRNAQEMVDRGIDVTDPRNRALLGIGSAANTAMTLVSPTASSVLGKIAAPVAVGTLGMGAEHGAYALAEGGATATDAEKALYAERQPDASGYLTNTGISAAFGLLHATPQIMRSAGEARRINLDQKLAEQLGPQFEQPVDRGSDPVAHPYDPNAIVSEDVATADQARVRADLAKQQQIADAGAMLERRLPKDEMLRDQEIALRRRLAQRQVEEKQARLDQIIASERATRETEVTGRMREEARQPGPLPQDEAVALARQNEDALAIDEAAQATHEQAVSEIGPIKYGETSDQYMQRLADKRNEISSRAASGGMNFPKPESKAPKPPKAKVESLEKAAPGVLPEFKPLDPGVAEELVPGSTSAEAPRQVEAAAPEVAPVADVPTTTTPIVYAEPPVQRTQLTPLQEKLAADRAAIEAQRIKNADIVEQRKIKLAQDAIYKKQREDNLRVEQEMRNKSGGEVAKVESPTGPAIKVYKTAAGNYLATSGELPEGATLVTRTEKNAERYDKFVEKEKNNPTTKLRDPNALRSGKTSLIGDTADAIKRVFKMTSPVLDYIRDTKLGDSIQNIKARIGNINASYKHTEDALSSALKKDFAYAKDRIEREFIKPNADAIAELGRKYGFISDDLATTIEKRGGEYRTVFRPIFDSELGPKHVEELIARSDWPTIKNSAIDGLAKDFFKGDKVAATEHLTKYLESFDKGDKFKGGKIGGPLDPANLKARKDVPTYLEPILGRITDPAKELMFTLRAQHKVLTDFVARQDIIETGKSQGWASDKPKAGEIGWVKDDRLGVYLNKEARDLLTDIGGKPGAYMKAANWFTSIYNATSITFQGVRQLGLGAGEFGVTALTHLPTADVKHLGKYLKIALNQVTPEYRGDVKKIFDIATKQSKLMRDGQILGHSVAAPTDVILGRDRDILHKAIAKLQIPGTAIDNATRAMVYEIQRDHLRNVFPGKTASQIDAIAHERINNITVTPSNAMKFVRELKRMPGASYVATFMTEKVRNTFNLARYYVQDMRVAPPAYRAKIGAKLAMLGLPLLGPSLVEQISRESANVTPEQEKAYRETRDFALTKTLAFFRDESGNLDAYDISVVDPLSWPRQAARAMGLVYDKANSKDGITGDDIKVIAKDAAPFLIHPLIDKVVQASGKLREGDVEGAAKDISLAFTPGNIRRTAQAEGAVAAAKEFAVGGLAPFSENERRDYATDKLYGGVDMTLASKIRDKKSEGKVARKKFYSEIQNRDGTKNPAKLLEASQAFLDETADEWKKTIEQVKAMRGAGDSVDRIRKTLNAQSLSVPEQEALLAGEAPKRPTARAFALKERIRWLEDASERLSAARGAKGAEKAELYKSLQGTDMRGMMDAIRKARLARKIIERYDRIGTDIPNDVYERLISQMQ